jgi:hypothetical protein
MRINHPSEEQIRARAFEIYVERGGGPGHELDDWLQAEFELAHLPFHVAHLQPIRARRRKLSYRWNNRASTRETLRSGPVPTN